jgi:hypothetical protein
VERLGLQDGLDLRERFLESAGQIETASERQVEAE